MPKAICVTGWKYEVNILSIMRTADGLGFDDLVLAGTQKLDVDRIKKIAKRNLVDLVGGLHLVYLPDIDAVWQFIHEKHYTPVVMECNKGTGTNLDDFTWPNNPIIVLGHEVVGVPLQHFAGAQQVYMGMMRTATSMNLACAASIAMYSLHLQEVKTKKVP
nr:TrmH family RNA methyltransferase [Candidatus Sigynarchaeota archaeon]